MAGHSKWETTKRQKGANDAKRGALFTKLGNQVAIAARAGADPTTNSALAMAIERARAANVPNANIDRAIARANDKNAAVLEEITYEGIGPAGVGLVIETATDNRNRTFPEVRTALVKNGARVADAGSVLFQFKRQGVIDVAETGEEALLTVLEAGAEDAEEVEGKIVVYTDQKELAAVRSAIKASGLTVVEAELQYIASNPIEIDDEASSSLEKIMDALDEVDDVVNVYTTVA